MQCIDKVVLDSYFRYMMFLMSIDVFATVNEAKRLRASARYTVPNKFTKKPKAKPILVS